MTSSKHTGVRSLFHQNFVKPGIVKIEYGHFYDKLFRNRQKGDYTDFIRYKIEEVTPWLEETKKFVDNIESIIKKEIEKEEE